MALGIGDVVNWPLAALIFGLVTLVGFRKPIYGLFSRAHKIGPAGLEASLPPAQQLLEPRKDETLSVPDLKSSLDDYQKAIGPYRFARAASKAAEVRQQMNIDALEVEALRTMMVDLASIIMVTVDFENYYSLIYGSQLGVLYELNGVFGVGLSTTDVKTFFYDRAAEAFPEFYATVSFEAWLMFVRNAGLVWDVSPQVIGITVDGRDFLRWLILTGKALRKKW